MPYPNEHAARVKQPSGFIDDSFRRKTIEKGLTVIMARLKDKPDEMVVQAYRFNVKYFTAAEAKNWLEDKNVEYLAFEPASEKKEDNNIIDDEEKKIQSELKDEFRYLTDQEYKNRFVLSEDGDRQDFVEGVGIVYNSRTEIYPGVYEIIATGAFSESLSRNRTIKSFINHNPTKILSTTRSEPALEILDGENFMEFIAPIPPTSYGKDLVVNLERGNIRGASFSFTIADNGDHYKKLSDGSLLRTITEAEIYEVGPVTNPAYEQTEVNLRNKEFFSKVKEQLTERNHDDKQLKTVIDFLQNRKGL